MSKLSRTSALLLSALAACGTDPSGSPDAGVHPAIDASEPGPRDAGAHAADAALPGPDAGGPAPCTRQAQATTAPLNLLRGLTTTLPAAPDQPARDALVAGFLADLDAQGGAPLREAGTDRVAFVVRGTPSSGGYSVAGSFNGWTAGALAMVPLAGTDLYTAEAQVPRTEAHAYKFVDGATWLEDGRAQHLVWDGIDRKGPGEFNAQVHPELQPADRGRLVALRGVHATALSDDRDVFVYLPPAYDDGSCSRLPALYFNDGNEALTRVPFSQAADETYRATPSASAVLVFVGVSSLAVREDQYTFGTAGARGDDYVAFLDGDLLPAIERRFRLCPAARDRGISGVSLGGLIAAYAAFHHPDRFGFVGAQSASFWWNGEALIDYAATAPVVPVRFWLDYGCPEELDNCDDNRRMVSTLSVRGYDATSQEVAGGIHDWSAWAPRVPGLLRYFREGRSGCAVP